MDGIPSRQSFFQGSRPTPFLIERAELTALSRVCPFTTNGNLRLLQSKTATSGNASCKFRYPTMGKATSQHRSKRLLCVSKDINCRVGIEPGCEAANHAAKRTMKQASGMSATRINRRRN
jgi:hypothetical protein